MSAASGVDARAAAAHVVHRVRAGASLEAALSNSRASERALLYDLAYGTIRHLFTLQKVVGALVKKPLREKDADVECLLLVGAYQLLYGRTPRHAAVSQTVQAASALRKPWAKGLLNAVLRRLPETAPEVAELPGWLAKRLTAAYPEHAEALAQINQSRAPMAIRVNRLKTSLREYRTRLPLAPRRVLADGFVLARPLATAALPGFSAGHVAVQDEGAQLAAPLLAPAVGASVLDACAAPGGKSFHLLERNPTIRLVALELNPERASHIRAEAKRLGHAERLDLKVADATDTEWWDGKPFDHILLDAPCSATGTLRRHPDVKLHRTPTDIETLQQLQLRLLGNVWRTLRRGGTLLYCTCSILPEENEGVVAQFLEQTDGVVVRGLRVPGAHAKSVGSQLLPTIDGPDGFYYALLEKAA